MPVAKSQPVKRCQRRRGLSDESGGREDTVQHCEAANVAITVAPEPVQFTSISPTVTSWKMQLEARDSCREKTCRRTFLCCRIPRWHDLVVDGVGIAGAAPFLYDECVNAGEDSALQSWKLPRPAVPAQLDGD